MNRARKRARNRLREWKIIYGAQERWQVERTARLYARLDAFFAQRKETA